MAFPHLFSPVTLGTIEVANRTAMAPINNGLLSTDETWPLRTIRYYEERARGGIGLIITGAVRVSELAGIPKVGIFHERFIPSHRRLVDRIHGYDTKILCQLTLNGGKVGKEAPSSIYSPAYPTRPPELTAEQIEGLVRDFIRAAGYAREAGYDGVEVHGGHTYLVGQMMSPATNVRTDDWGGSFENRMRFPAEVIRGIEREYPGFPAGIKFSAYEELPGGIDVDLGVEIARYLATLDPAYLHVSATSTSLLVKSRYSSVPHMYAPRNTLMPLAEKIKRACPDAVVMGTGGITVPEDAERFIAEGACDMVALGRTVVAEPNWPRKAREGARRFITPCIRCNVCYEQLWKSRPLVCSVNPYVSREAEEHLSPSSRPRKIMIVGAGPAGIRTAITAAKRNHTVSLYERDSSIGGMVRPGSTPVFKEELRFLLDHWEDALAESGAMVRLNTEVTPALVAAESPDVLVIAVGAEPVRPEIPGINNHHVVDAVTVLRDAPEYPAKSVAVIGGGEVGCEVACHLADRGARVTVIEQRPEMLPESSVLTRTHMELLIDDRDVTVLTGIPVSAVVTEGVEIVKSSGKKALVEAELVVYAVGMREPGKNAGSSGTSLMVQAESGPVAELGMHAEGVHVIGDCNSVGRILDAVEAGERIGRWI